MATHRDCTGRVLDRYVDTLLAEPPRPAAVDLRELTLTQVAHSHEMIGPWRKARNDTQALSIALMLWAHSQKRSQARLRSLLGLSVCRHHPYRSAHGR